MNSRIFSSIVLCVLVMTGIQGMAKNPSVRPIDQAVQQYVAISQALNQDDAKAAQKQAVLLTATLGDLNGADVAAKAARQLAAAKDLSSQRSSFARLTLALHQVLTLDKPSAMLYIHYCPMAKAYWMDAGKAIANPYLGKSMSSCGKTTGMLM